MKDVVLEAIENAKREHIERIKDENMLHEALRYMVCPSCGGQLTNVTGFFKKIFSENKELLCGSCGNRHILEVHDW